MKSIVNTAAAAAAARIVIAAATAAAAAVGFVKAAAAAGGGQCNSTGRGAQAIRALQQKQQQLSAKYVVQLVAHVLCRASNGAHNRVLLNACGGTIIKRSTQRQ
jgi:hypothetical protein